MLGRVVMPAHRLEPVDSPRHEPAPSSPIKARPTRQLHDEPLGIAERGQLSERGTRAFFPPPIVYGRSTTSRPPVLSVIRSPILSCIGRPRIWTPSGVFPRVAVAITRGVPSPG